MDYGRIKTEYLCYLMNRAGLEAEGEDGYLRLCETLMEIQFIPILYMDENRCYECQVLRYDFAESEGSEDAGDILDGFYSEWGTMMEILLVLAERIQYEMQDSQFEASARKWFLEMLENCGIGKCLTNGQFEAEGNEEAVRDAMDTVIYRKTDWDGSNGLFPVTNPRYDQRTVELIIQMNNYLEENYDIL